MGRDCWAHAHRDDVPLEVHHIWPLGLGGPDTRGNRVSLCANAHSATHDLLGKMLKARTSELSWLVRRRYGRKIRRLANAGYTAVMTRGVTRP